MVKQISQLEWNDLLNWRRERKLTSDQLAKLLDVSRNTVSRWERGHVRMPAWLAPKLEELAFTLAPKPQAAAPEWVSYDNWAALRMDLYLYEMKQRGVSQRLRGPEHPARLLGEPHPLMVDRGPTMPGKWPWSVLESDEYRAALAVHRAQK